VFRNLKEQKKYKNLIFCVYFAENEEEKCLHKFHAYVIHISFVVFCFKEEFLIALSHPTNRTEMPTINKIGSCKLYVVGVNRNA